MSEVQVGQVWADMDSRSQGRRVRIVAVEATHATVEVIANGHGTFSRLGRQTRVLLRRFKPTSTGYRLVDPNPSQHAHAPSPGGRAGTP